MAVRILTYINILSIDVALGAVSGCAFFASVFGVQLRPHAYLGLGLIVWIVYTIDHLFDAARSAHDPFSRRHQFHRRHASVLTAAVVLAATALTVEAFLVRKPVLFAGIGVATLVIAYLWLQANLRFLKEIAGAMLYVSGIIAAPWSLLNRPLQLEEWLLILLYLATAYVNLLLFSLFGHEGDLQDGHVSTTTHLGPRIAGNLVRLVFGIILAGLGILATWGYFQLAAVLLLMNTGHGVIYLRPDFFRVDDRYRLVGDLVFLLPGLAILVGLTG
ncbi:MAG: hypothetical protein JNN04_09475 [Cyclobacteriaceae bacterium]|nr:hypothetical protein [Cyclobacteriaceae bacterium]